MTKIAATLLACLCLLSAAGCVSRETTGSIDPIGNPRTEPPQPNGGSDPAHQSGFQE